MQQLEEELKKLKVSDLLVQTLYTVSSLGYRRLSEEDRDLDQARLAIEALRALLPVLEELGERGARPGLQAGDGEPPARLRGRGEGWGLTEEERPVARRPVGEMAIDIAGVHQLRLRLKSSGGTTRTELLARLPITTFASPIPSSSAPSRRSSWPGRRGRGRSSGLSLSSGAPRGAM